MVQDLVLEQVIAEESSGALIVGVARFEAMDPWSLLPCLAILSGGCVRHVTGSGVQVQQGLVDGAGYDVVVIGAGMGGLAAGAFLARAGRRVLVVERSDRIGGLLAELPDEQFHVSAAVHNLTEAFDDGPAGEGIMAAAARHLAMDGYELVPVDTSFSVHTPDAQVQVPADRQGWIDAFTEVAPSRRAALGGLMDLCEEVARQLASFPVESDLSTLLRMPSKFPALIRHRSSTVQDVVGEQLGDPRLTALVTTLCRPYLGRSPARSSFLLWAVMTAHYAAGTYVSRGGYQRVADGFRAAIEARDSAVVTSTEVSAIRTANGRVAGVAGDDWEVRCPTIVATIDPRQLPAILDTSLPGGYQRRLVRPELSDVFLGVYLTTDRDLSEAPITYESFVSETSDLTYAPGIHVPTLADPDSAPDGHHAVVLMTTVRGISVDPTECAADLQRRAERHVPALSGHLTPMLNPAGAPATRVFAPAYGYAPTPSQVGLGRLGHRTPVGGLYLAGQWTRPGHSIPGVVRSGARVARIITDDRPHEPLLPL